MRLDEGSALLYLYRDRPEYEAARPKLAPPAEAQQSGPIRFEPTQQVEMQVPNTPTGKLGDIIAEAQKLQEMYGGGQSAPLGAPGDRLPTPDPERLARIAKLRASGAIDDAEHAKLRARPAHRTPPQPPTRRNRPRPAAGPRSLPIGSIRGCGCGAAPGSSIASSRATGRRSESTPRTPTASFRGGRAPVEVQATPARRSGTTSGSSTATVPSTPPAGRPTPPRWTRRATGRSR